MAHAFEEEGAFVCILDLLENPYFVGDLTDYPTLQRFVKKVIDDYGQIDVLINNACPLFKGIDDCSYEEFNQALLVGATAPFMLTKLFLPYFTEGASIINLSSTRDRMSQPQSESYSAAKGAIQALTHALAISLGPRKIRVNSISPGWINTTNEPTCEEDHLQQPVGRIGKPEDIAYAALFLASEKASFITGENICIDGGMTRQMIYHGEHGWKFQKNS